MTVWSFPFQRRTLSSSSSMIFWLIHAVETSYTDISLSTLHRMTFRVFYPRSLNDSIYNFSFSLIGVSIKTSSYVLLVISAISLLYLRIRKISTSSSRSLMFCYSSCYSIPSSWVSSELMKKVSGVPMTLISIGGCYANISWHFSLYWFKSIQLGSEHFDHRVLIVG